MQVLIVLRHAVYDSSTGDLLSAGIKQMQKLGEQLREQLVGKKILILSSPYPRAEESAELLAVALNAPIEVHDALSQDVEGHTTSDFPQTYDLVCAKEESVDVLILVTHVHHAMGFPEYFCSRKQGFYHGGAHLHHHEKVPNPGEGMTINCENYSIRPIRAMILSRI